MDIFFADNLKYLRKQHDKNRAEMATALGFNESTWGNYEANYSKPKFDDLIKICQYFGISETDLIHKDLSKGNLIKTGKDTKNKEKGNLKGNPIGHLNEPNEGYNVIVNNPITAHSRLQKLAQYMQQAQSANTAINAELACILEELMPTGK